MTTNKSTAVKSSSNPTLDQILTTYGVVHTKEVSTKPKKKKRPVKQESPKITVQDNDSKYWSRFFTKAEKVNKVENIEQPIYTDKDLRLATSSTEKELPPKLDKNVELVRNFFLKELSPLTLAASAGIDQAQEVLQRVTDSEVDPQMGLVFKRMLIEGVKLRLAQFITNYLKLPDSDVHEILSIFKPTPGVNFNIQPDDHLGRPLNQKHNSGTNNEANVKSKAPPTRGRR